MKHNTTWLVSSLLLFGSATLRAQATGMPTFNSPYAGYRQSEFGVETSFPNGAGTAFEAVYHYSAGSLDIGLRGGMWDPGVCCRTELLLGVEARERVIAHTTDFPLDGGVLVGAGTGIASGGSALFVPLGVSLGRKIEPSGSSVVIAPYVQPTATLVGDHGTTVDFTLGLGADLRLTPAFLTRISVGVGDLNGVSVGAMWVH
ncbi:MAG TPA: hypothetical protein VLV45_15420 [Gemmatimonadales bacterium]|nr:hypothetical protein [Gemmatimonadales bacterium]